MNTKNWFRKQAVFLLLALLAGLGLGGQERFRRTPPLPEPLLALRLPNIESATLSNGLKLAVAYRQGLPLLSLQLVILSGENSSPLQLPGCATAAAHMFDRGTLTSSALKIEERIDSLGGSLSISVHPDITLISFTFLEEYLDSALELLAEMILQPLWTEQEWVNIRRILTYELQDKENDPDFVARRLLFRLLYRKQPAREALLSSDLFRNMRLKDVSDFAVRHYRPNNALLVLAGDISLRTAARKVSHYLNTWPPLPGESPPSQSPRPNSDLRLCFVDVPGSAECTIFLGNIGPPASTPDFFSLLVFNQLLGGTPYSRFFLNLRESKAYAYYAFSEIIFLNTHSIFLVRARVRPAAAAAAVAEILREMRRAMTERVLPAEIEQAKSYLLGNVPLTIERLERFSDRVAELQAFRLGPDHWNQFMENIMLVSGETVQEAVQNLPLLSPVVVIAGDQSILVDPLRSFEKVEVYDKKGELQYSLSKEK
jgi:zinc protease